MLVSKLFKTDKWQLNVGGL